MTALVKHVESPTERSLRLLRIEAEQIGRSGLVPEALRGPEHTADLILVGLTAQALGVTNLATAVAHVHVIDGKPAISAALAIGVAEAHAGAMWMVEESTNERCRVRGRRRDWPASWPDTVIEFTIEDARRAGLLDVTWVLFKWDAAKKKNVVQARWTEGEGDRPEWATPSNRDAKRSMREPWHRWPAAMCFARATKALAKALGGQALVGLHGRPIDLDVDLEDVVGPDVDTAGEVNGRPVVDVAPEPDDDPVDAELVEDFPAAWARRCTENAIDPATSARILTFVCGAEKARQVPAEKHDEAHDALDAWLAGELDLGAA